MGKYRTPSKRSKYYIPREDYLTAVHYCLRYPLWVAELEVEPDTTGSFRYDQEKVQTSGDFDPVQTMAIRRAEMERKKKLVEDTAREATHTDPVMYRYLMLGVTKGLTVWQLQAQGMPTNRGYYQTIRQRFYYLLSEKI